MPKISQIINNKFPYPPTEGQKELFDLFDELLESENPRTTLLVRGYAGTGKTAAVACFVKVLPLFNYKSLLLAPTGRAAKVVSNYAGRSAFTIHKIIYKNSIDRENGELVFKRQKNSHKRTIFIVDEASMIQEEGENNGISVLRDLLDFVFEHESNKLILIGDDAQLPPVGRQYSAALDTANLLDKYELDLIETSLTDVVRQDKDSGILEIATNLRKMIPKPMGKISLNTGNFNDVVHVTSQSMEDYLQKAYNDYGHVNTIVICRSNREAVQLNRYIRSRIFFREEQLEAGDSVMIVRNNYYWLPEDSKTGFLANGDFAEVLRISNHEERYGLHFANLRLRLVDYPEMEPFEAKTILDTLNSQTPSLSPLESKNLYDQVARGTQDVPSKQVRAMIQSNPYLNALQIKFTHAITCHKSQGGQWPAVFVKHGYLKNNIPDTEYLRWLYTGISRATEICFFVDFVKE